MGFPVRRNPRLESQRLDRPPGGLHRRRYPPRHGGQQQPVESLGAQAVGGIEGVQHAGPEAPAEAATGQCAHLAHELVVRIEEGGREVAARQLSLLVSA